MDDGVVTLVVVLALLFGVALAMPRPASRPLTDDQRRELEEFERWLRVR